MPVVKIPAPAIELEQVQAKDKETKAPIAGKFYLNCHLLELGGRVPLRIERPVFDQAQVYNGKPCLLTVKISQDKFDQRQVTLEVLGVEPAQKF